MASTALGNGRVGEVVRLHIVYNAPRVNVPRAALAVGCLLAVLGLVVAASISVVEGPVICPFRAITGLPCPSCGLLRSANALLCGQMGAAFATNPLAAVFLLVVVPVGAVIWTARWWRGIVIRMELTGRERRIAWTVLIVVVAVNWAYVLATHA